MKIRILMMLAVLASIQGGIKNNGDAPNFILLNQDNIEVSLDQFKGKKVILEWTNHECPFVKRHYDTENMQSLQREMADQNIVWLSIISSAPNKQGFVTKSEAQELTVERNASPSHVLFDEDGIVGRSYDAKTTPHMYLIDEKGSLKYQGAIDDLGGTGALFSVDLSLAKNYVKNAVTELANGLKVSEHKTRPYCCSIKY